MARQKTCERVVKSLTNVNKNDEISEILHGNDTKYYCTRYNHIVGNVI